jgi:hypothetical protein
MTEEHFPDLPGPEDVAPLVVWLGSTESAHVTGRVFEVAGGTLTVVGGFTRSSTVDNDGRFDPATLGATVAGLLAGTDDPVPVYGA